MDARLNGMLWGSFAGDALSLGAHWIYNPGKIKRKFERLSNYLDPLPDSYHPKRKAGDFTHYGDQSLTLLQSVGAKGAFDLTDFCARWQAMWKGYPGYVDGATTATLKNLDAGKPPTESGSSSNDLAGASRIAPILFNLATGPEEALLNAIVQQTAMTHNHPQVIESAVFFAWTVKAILDGKDVEEALNFAARQDYAELPAAEWVAKASALREEDAVPALGKLGLTCHVDEAFQSTVCLLLKYPTDLETSLIENVMTGGDSAARGMIVGMVLGAALGEEAVPRRWIEGLNTWEQIQTFVDSGGSSPAMSQAPALAPGKLVFPNAEGIDLAGRLEMPDGKPLAYAIFAHCFTCSKDIAAATRISRGLAKKGLAVLRFDFTGLGNSEGDFANTNFSSNVEDLVAAANHLRQNKAAPSLLIGHSLGGAAVLAAAARIPEVKGVVTIGAPSDPGHVAHLFSGSQEEIDSTGEAEVQLGRRTFTIKKQFLEDIQEQRLLEVVRDLRVSLLVMHSPVDQTVGIEHAGHIYGAAKHPKSFVSLDPADHLLTQKEDSTYVAKIISAWASRVVAR
jgi:putative redox protein